jgi:spermidine synthase
MGTLFYYNGALKGTSVGQVAAYESFVHPPMFAHNLPRRVVIFGTGLGATIRELLKYKALEEVIVVGANEELITFARKHLSTLSECSHTTGRQKCCFDDPRVQFVYGQTPFEWISSYEGEPLDVAFVDLS